MKGKETFFGQEFKNLNLRDIRLDKRAITIGDKLLQNPTSCIQSLMNDKNDARCTYDFFSNSKVKWAKLFEPHQQKTIDRINNSNSKYIYIIQDSTFYNYTSHKAKTDVGIIGQQGSHTQFGLIQHSSFCIDSNNIPLGILGMDLMGYQDSNKYSLYRSDFENLSSSRWRMLLDSDMKLLKQGGCKKDIVLLCDREADFFQFHDDIRNEGIKYVIRCKYLDRVIGKSSRARKNKLFILFNKQNAIGCIKIDVTDPKTSKENKTTFEVKILKDILIPPSYRGAGHIQNQLEPITMNIVQVCSEDMNWTLLTNLSVDSMKDIEFVINSYKQRWHIESFHKVLKTAYQADRVYLHSSREAIQNLLTLINISAYQTYTLMHVARSNGDLPPDIFLSDSEIKAIKLYFNDPSLQTLADFYYKIAILGGYKNRNNKKSPGILTLYRGIKKLNNITEMMIVMSTKT